MPWIVESVALGALVLVPLRAWWVRGRVYAIFALVILLLSLPGAVVMHARLLGWASPALSPWITLAFAYPLAAAAVHLASLVRARLRPRVFRLMVSLPGMTFVGAGFLSLLWLLALWPVRGLLGLVGWNGALAALRWLDLVPFAVAAGSVVTSGRLVDEVVRVDLGDDGPRRLTRLPVTRHRGRTAPPLPARPLRIVQIADPHLGPWQPVDLLRRRVERLLAHDPDLVVLTGDFLTMEGAGSRGALAQALAPLARVADRCFSILGNHDHDDGAREEVERALGTHGVRLLVDDETSVETPIGPVQLVGADWMGRGRREHIQALLARHPRRSGHLRVLLLHDPSVFRHVPPGDVDLVLAGHTHGGQLGLLSLGLPWTVLSRTAWPDHGLFGHGATRLYVHRGTGFYGFPLRIGVPGEASLLEVVLSGSAPGSGIP